MISKNTCCGCNCGCNCKKGVFRRFLMFFIISFSFAMIAELIKRRLRANRAIYVASDYEKDLQPTQMSPEDMPTSSEESPQTLKKTIQKNISQSQKTQPDDLKLIEGIGPKISTVLNNAGVHTFAQLAEMNVVQIKGILKNANIRLANADTWSEQARLAAQGEWENLKALQTQLKGGTRPA